jgi:hypothetical protein
MIVKMLKLTGLTIIILLSCRALAQGQQGGVDPTGANVTYEFAPSGGQILPNQIPGMTEIIGLGGARLGFRMAPRVFFFGERALSTKTFSVRSEWIFQWKLSWVWFFWVAMP